MCIYTNTHTIIIVKVDAERTELLKHPLALSLLAYKWETYGRYIYYSNLFIYALFIIFLTAFALLVPHPGTRTCEIMLSCACLLLPHSIHVHSGAILSIYLSVCLSVCPWTIKTPQTFEFRSICIHRTFRG